MDDSYVINITSADGRLQYYPRMILEIYVKEGCWSCAEAGRIIADVQRHFPAVQMKLRDIRRTSPPDVVFATPTYLLNGRILFLGNPARDELSRKLADTIGSHAQIDGN